MTRRLLVSKPDGRARRTDVRPPWVRGVDAYALTSVAGR
jgi:hypothetical protein